jgi:hypothetical protein
MPQLLNGEQYNLNKSAMTPQDELLIVSSIILKDDMEVATAHC